MIEPWVQEEIVSADLGDKRLDRRFPTLLSALAQRPNLSIPAACGGHADMTAAYRFFANDKVTFDKILQPHGQRTRQRLAQQTTALLVQDTTEINLTRPQQEVQGAGTLDGVRRGFLLHEMQAFTTDGLPLGTVASEILNRTAVTHASAQPRAARARIPIEEKESFRWLEGLRQARQLAQKLPGVQCIYVADSEADIYEVLAEPRGTPAVDWLIRACQDRALHGEGLEHLRHEVLQTPPLYEVALHIRGRQSKTAGEARPRRLSRHSRRAQAEVRATTLSLRPPWRPDRRLPVVPVQVVLVQEVSPPADEPPVEWLLLTTLPIGTLEQVRAVVSYYCIRWAIEIFFRILKSGCRIERRRFEEVGRVEACLALYLIVAWRTFWVCRLGRSCPEVECEVVFEPSEWKAVWVAVKGQDPPPKAPPLREVVHLVARLGGYVERPRSEPGPQVLWIGMQRAYDLALAWDTFGPGSKFQREIIV